MVLGFKIVLNPPNSEKTALEDTVSPPEGLGSVPSRRTRTRLRFSSKIFTRTHPFSYFTETFFRKSPHDCGKNVQSQLYEIPTKNTKRIQILWLVGWKKNPTVLELLWFRIFGFVSPEKFVKWIRRQYVAHCSKGMPPTALPLKSLLRNEWRIKNFVSVQEITCAHLLLSIRIARL